MFSFSENGFESTLGRGQIIPTEPDNETGRKLMELNQNMQKIVSATDRSPVRHHKVKLTTPYDKLKSLSPRSRFSKELKSVTLI